MKTRINYRRGFTVTELLVVIAIIALLIALLIVGISKARLLAQVASCLSNQRQIALAQVTYSVDNGGAMASPRTSIPGDLYHVYNLPCGSFPISINNGNTVETSYHSWVASYGAGLVGGVEYQYGVNSTVVNAKALSGGRLYPYMGSAQLYRSPLDPTTRIRSYSLSAFVGVMTPHDNFGFGQTWAPWFCAQGVTPREMITSHTKHIKQPSQTLLSIVESDGTTGLNYNQQPWVIDPRPPVGTPAPAGAPNPAAWGTTGGWQGWIDTPAFWEPNYITYSYVDGSTESYSLQNSRLVALVEGPPGGGYGPFYAQPADNLTTGSWRRDFMHFRDRLLPGIFPPMMPRNQQ
ncbi:MAG: prepilin-type N-terminal cleavage/methylation domain-containing protein [Phycisphaerales bacterium]|nr:prepilin-type N-terminal cleavage/methylation domain-containing protein [Phycisphaerales bacterium]